MRGIVIALIITYAIPACVAAGGLGSLEQGDFIRVQHDGLTRVYVLEDVRPDTLVVRHTRVGLMVLCGSAGALIGSIVGASHSGCTWNDVDLMPQTPDLD
jgi:hypothetical protein